MTTRISHVVHPDLQPGAEEWRVSIIDNQRVVVVGCPKCGVYNTMEDHKISEIGVVTPSVICGIPNCGFHDHIVLDEWERYGFNVTT